MEFIGDLYKVLILLSAGILLLGLILNITKASLLTLSLKIIIILAIVNVISIGLYVVSDNNVEINHSDSMVLFESIILILNLIIGRFIYIAYTKNEISIEQIIKRIFLYTIISECIFLILIYTQKLQYNFYDTKNEGFFLGYGFLLILLIGGTVYPGVMSVASIIKEKKKSHRIEWLLILNMLNNIIGLLLYSIGFPNNEIALLLNMLINIVFSYYYGYLMLSYYFEKKKLKSSNLDYNAFSWEELKKHLHHWSEMKSYLQLFMPELLERIDNYPITDLEKIHLVLKELKIKPKEIATVLNVSTRAVEMQRYRINKKISAS